jgi:isoamyl acetate esterase
MPTLVCFGDSITAKERDEAGTIRLTPRLKQMLPDWSVRNSGVPGDNTTRALNRLQKDVLAYYPDLVTVLLGTSDASEKRRVPIEEYESNIASIAYQISPQKTILISPAPIAIERLLDRNRRRNSPLSNFVTLEDLEHYAQVSEKVARTTGSHFINLWGIMKSQSDYSRYLKDEDGVHFNERGYKFLASVVTAKINSIWPYASGR